MRRAVPSVLALVALSGAALVAPLPASAEPFVLTGTVTVTGASVRFDPSGRSGSAQVAYRCVRPGAATTRTELSTALYQPSRAKTDTAVAFPDRQLFVTCDDTARTTTVRYTRTHVADAARPVRDGRAALSFSLGSGGPGDLVVPDQAVTVRGVTLERGAPAFDLDGDGHDELVVGAPGEKIASADFAGSVSVLPGTVDGPTADGDQLWSQDSAGVAGGAEFGDRFGAVVASGDFDGDGHADLAVGVPAETIGSTTEAGLVNVLYGSASGLRSARDQAWSEDSRGVPGSARAGDRFGSTLAVGDFDGDGYADLAVGSPSDSTVGSSDAGLVNVFYGSRTGLRSARAQLWAQSSKGVQGSSELGDQFGAALSAADVDGDGRADLAVGVPGENAGAGAVALLRGGAKGLTAARDQLWSQDSRGVQGTAGTGDAFGAALAFGDVDADGHPDLAIGIPSETVQVCDECDSQGAVQVLRGARTGLTAAGDRVWQTGQPGLPGDPADANEFGAALASGDFDGDGTADLAVAAPGAAVGDVEGGGTVYVLTGSASGLTPTSLITQATPGVPGDPETVGGFQMTLAARRFSAAHDSLVVGLPGIRTGGQRSAGGVLVVPGSDAGLDPGRTRLWTQDTPGVKEDAEDLDQFGHVAG